MLEGSDPKLKDQYIVFTAHMDHVGVRSGDGDSIYNGADDNASGTAGVIALAKAFSQAGVRPRRSLLFLVVSGEEKGFGEVATTSSIPPSPWSRSWPTSIST